MFERIYGGDWSCWDDIVRDFYPAGIPEEDTQLTEPDELLFAVSRIRGGFQPSAFIIGWHDGRYFILEINKPCLGDAFYLTDWHPECYNLDDLIRLLEKRFLPEVFDPNALMAPYAVAIMKTLWQRNADMHRFG